MERKSLLWTIGFTLVVATLLGFIAFYSVYVDPFFHYSEPKTDEFFYPIDNQRSQNDGILKHFRYQGIITGTSMTENFKTSEAETIWGCSFVKVPFSGGLFKEINDNLIVALKNNPEIKIIIRGLDMTNFLVDKDKMRTDLGEYPTYLYDNNIFNDVQYVFNRDVVFSRVYDMMKKKSVPAFKPGITSFDVYSNWTTKYKYGKKILYSNGITVKAAGKPVNLSEKNRKAVLENIQQNITSLANKYPNVTFYYFFPPYSAKWWQNKIEDGRIYEQIQAERIVIEEILKCPNIKLYSFNNLAFITTDLNNYRDITHYSQWINSLILRYMFDEKCLLTANNYEDYLDEELRLYTTLDYEQMYEQEDYIHDYYASLALEEKEFGRIGTEIDFHSPIVQLSNSEIVENQYNGKPGIMCKGSLQRDYHIKEQTIGDYLRNVDYIGFKIEIDNINALQYIVFLGKKIADCGQPTVYLYDPSGRIIRECVVDFKELDNEWHHYMIDVRNVKGKATIIFNGGYIDVTGRTDSQFVFSNVKFYY